MVQSSMQRRADQRAVPLSLSGLLLPVEQIVGGEDFCVALMQNGLVFSWGDGEEGKLGLGQQASASKPTMIDALLPTAYAEVAKRSENKDELLKAGSKLIRTRGRAFQVTSLACGARHTLALTSTSEVFTWGSGCCGQLGHGSRHDELLPRPLQGLHKTKELRAHAISAGAYHSAAIIGFSKRKAPMVFTWGDGTHGRLGLGDDRTRTAPNEVHYHRVVPRKRVDLDGQDDRTTGGLISFKYKGDWLSNDSGHALEWMTLACGGRHSAALTRAGQVYTWGSDDAGQLGHETKGVLQRLPCLLATLQRSGGTARGSRSWRRGAPVTDACQLGCGRTFTVVLTWSGEVWVWGELGGRSIVRPTVIERMLDAKVVRIACGAEHVALLTGDPTTLQQRVEHAHPEDQRAEALLHERESLELRRIKDAMRAEEDAARTAAEKAQIRAEKRRVKLLGRLAKQRAKQVGKEQKKREAEEKKEKELKAKALQEDEGGGAANSKGAPKSKGKKS